MARRPTTRSGSADLALAEGLAHALAPWFARAQRDLTWRRTRDPYAIWVSEIMLQQTRVETVERYYAGFLARFPDVGTLAAADEHDVLEAWSGLGYYRRARLLHRGARHVARELGGTMPSDAAGLLAIPGVGRYTAGALASIAFDRPVPLVDGNVARVLARVRGIEEPRLQGADAKEHWHIVQAVLERGSPRVLAQALMELGATVCTPRAASCHACPVADLCVARARGRVDAIPAPRKKIAQPLQRWVAPAIVWRGRMLLVRRDREGLLANMWCLPLVAVHGSSVEPAEVARAWPDVPARVQTVADTVKHVFTHRIWEMAPVRMSVGRKPNIASTETAWVRRGERPGGGLPSVTNKLLEAVGW
jgi:A/G-specific adenine glycosylase